MIPNAGNAIIPGIAAVGDRRYAPQIPGGLVVPLSLVIDGGSGAVAAFTANQARGCRVVMPKSGTLSSIAIYLGTSSGNVDVGVYSTAATRLKLWSLGSTATSGLTANAWNSVGNPALTVVQGEQYDFTVALDNATATVGESSLAAGGMGILPTGYLPGPAAAPKLNWVVPTSFPLPASFTEAAIGSSGTGVVPLIIALVT